MNSESMADRMHVPPTSMESSHIGQHINSILNHHIQPNGLTKEEYHQLLMSVPQFIGDINKVHEFALHLNFDVVDFSMIKKSHSIAHYSYLKKWENRDNYIAALDKTYSLENGELYWKNYIIKHDLWDNSIYYANNSSQKNFGLEMHKAIQLGILLVDKFDCDFSELLAFFAYRRQLMAEKLSHMNKYLYGASRHLCNNQFMKTPLINLYGEVGVNLRQKLAQKEGLQKGYSKPFEPPIAYDNPAFLRLMQANAGFYHIFIDGQKILLSGIQSNSQYTCIFHPDIEAIKKVKPYLKALYTEAMGSSDDQLIVRNSAKILWLSCHLKMVLYGDVSIAEMIFRIILAKKNMGNFSWKSGIIPWGEALLEFDIEAFADKFLTLFDISPSS